MPANLNLNPVGLLAFLGIKNGGQYPQELSTVLGASFELRPLYESNAPQIFGSTAPAAIGAGVTLFGPAGVTSTPGSVFHFQSVGLRINGSAGASTWYGSLGLASGATGTFVPFTDMQLMTNPGTPQQVGLQMGDVWVPPGWFLAVNTVGVGGAPNFDTSWLGYQYQF